MLREAGSVAIDKRKIFFSYFIKLLYSCNYIKISHTQEVSLKLIISQK